MDGTDCPIQEPSPFNKDWYSHKFKGPGLRYEIGLSLSGRIVWVNGPFKCGAFPDLKIFKLDMLQALFPHEKVIADSGYKHTKCVIPGDVFSCLASDGEFPTVHKRVRARHESVNERLKNFNVLDYKFRHDPSLHVYCFHAVAQLTAMMTDSSDSLFSL